MRTATCKKCDGKGKHPCDNCNGKGDNRDNIAKYGPPDREVETCIWCRGEGIVFCRDCGGDGKAQQPEPENSILRAKMHLEWIAVCRAVLDKQRNYDRPTKRLQTAIKNLLPDCAVVFEYRFEQYTMKIWDNTVREGYEDSLFLCWSEHDNGQRVNIWDAFEKELRRNDPSDSLERMEQEKAHASEFDAINTTIKYLEDQITQLRADADAVIKAIPIPESATLRTESFFWSSPTIYAKSTYPHIWPSKK